jgi:glycosyltransferase involved in cell wall biosynthesis
MQDGAFSGKNQEDYLASIRPKSAPLFEMTAQMIGGRKSTSSRDGSSNQINGRYKIMEQSIHRDRELEVSVIVPTFNRHDLLVKAVDSACMQSSARCEIVIVNDGGEDIPNELLDHFRGQEFPITVVQHKHNLGLGAARNTGAWLARGKWIMVLDDDDTLVEGSVKNLLDVAGADQDAKFIFGNHIRQFYQECSPKQVEYRRVDSEALHELPIENPIMCGSVVVDRQLFANLKGYREDLPVHEDYNFHIRVLSSIQPVHIDKPICVYHCRHSIPRLNHKRLYWFATCAFNHAVFRSLFNKANDRALKVAQRQYQYAHLERGIREGCSLDVARSLVNCWWDVLRSHGLSEEIRLDLEAIPSACPLILE